MEFSIEYNKAVQAWEIATPAGVERISNKHAAMVRFGSLVQTAPAAGVQARPIAQPRTRRNVVLGLLRRLAA